MNETNADAGHSNVHYYVEKLRVQARLSQPNLDPRDGSFQLFPRQGQENRPESLLELLNSRRAFVPFILAGDPQVLLVSRGNIDWVVVSRAVAPALIAPPGIEHTRTQRVELRFMDERHIETTVGWFAERSDQRLSDYLNSCDTYVASQVSFGTLIWNKNRIREARIVPEAAREAVPSTSVSRVA